MRIRRWPALGALAQSNVARLSVARLSVARLSAARLSVALLGAGLLLPACSEDEPAPPETPEITRGQAFCRTLESDTYVFDSLEITVRDLDGLEDLDAVRAVVLATNIELTAAEGVAPGEDCTPETCRNYTWTRTPDSEQIFCGEDGRLLEVEVMVDDLNGLSARAFVPTQPL
jgi:hypothetical protein